MSTTHDRTASFSRALEFIAEVRAGITYERFCSEALRCGDELVDLARCTEDATAFMTTRGIPQQYIVGNALEVLHRLHFNRTGDPFLAMLLPRTAMKSAISARWRVLMLLYHPDLNPDSKDAPECTRKVNEAYNILKNQASRDKCIRQLKDLARAEGETREQARAAAEHRATPAMEPSASVQPGFTRESLMHALTLSGERVKQRAIIAACLLIALVAFAVLVVENRALFSRQTRHHKVSVPEVSPFASGTAKLPMPTALQQPEHVQHTFRELAVDDAEGKVALR